MKSPTEETFYKPSFRPSLQCYDCPEIKRLDLEINTIKNKLDGLLVTSLSTFMTVILGFTIWLL